MYSTEGGMDIEKVAEETPHLIFHEEVDPAILSGGCVVLVDHGATVVVDDRRAGRLARPGPAPGRPRAANAQDCLHAVLGRG